MTTHGHEISLSDRDRVNILLEEYKALYSLLTFRLEAIDQRIPVAAGALVALLSSSSAFTNDQRLALLLGIPAACAWLHGTTVLHARSKEDVLRRIDEIERTINGLAAEELLVFQSRHPNRKRFVGGRSGFGSVLAVLNISVVAVAAALVIFLREFAFFPTLMGAYSVYAAASVLRLLRATWRLKGYRSAKSPPGDTPVFQAHGPSGPVQDACTFHRLR